MVLACSGYITTLAHSETPNSGTSVDIPQIVISLPLVLDGQYLGDIPVQIQGEFTKIQSSRALTLLGTILAPEMMESARVSLSEDYADINFIDIDGIEVSFDPQSLQINIKSVLNIRQIRPISIRSNDFIGIGPVIEPADFSLFATYSVGMSYRWQDNDSESKGLQALNGQIDIGGRVGQEKGIAFSSRLKYLTGRNGFLYRAETQAFYDILPKFIRATAGDLFVRGESFQIAPSMAGVTVEKYFDFDTRRIIRPVGRSLFDLERSSTIEVFQDGVLRLRRDLDAGRYSLNDLTLSQGANDIELRIIDDIGQETTVLRTDFFDFDLLQKGLSDFSFSFGVKSRQEFDRISYSDEPIMSGFYRHGLSETLTASANFQADMNGANAGGTALWATPLGSIQLETAASNYKNSGSGFALAGNYLLNKDFGDNKTWSFNLSSRYRTANFASVSSQVSNGGLERAADRNDSLQITADSRVSSQKWSASAFANYSEQDNRKSFNAGVGASYRLRPDISVSIFAQHSENSIETEQGIRAQIAWRIGDHGNARAKYDSRRNQAEVTYDRSSPQFVNSLSYGVGAALDLDTKGTEFFGNANFTGNRYEASARHTISTNDTSLEDIQQTSRINIASSLVYADGAFGLARPVNENFAILAPHSTLTGKNLTVSPSSKGVAAKSDFLGAPIATQISPFDSRVTYIDVEDLPIGYDIGSSGFTTKPYQFSGYKIPIGSNASYSVIGKVFNAEDHSPLKYLGGRFENLDDPDVEPVPAFTNRNGRLAATGLTAGRHRLVLLTNPEFSMEVKIDDSENPLIDLGDIKVEIR